MEELKLKEKAEREELEKLRIKEEEERKELEGLKIKEEEEEERKELEKLKIEEEKRLAIEAEKEAKRKAASLYDPPNLDQSREKSRRRSNH